MSGTDKNSYGSHFWTKGILSGKWQHLCVKPGAWCIYKLNQFIYNSSLSVLEFCACSRYLIKKYLWAFLRPWAIDTNLPLLLQDRSPSKWEAAYAGQSGSHLLLTAGVQLQPHQSRWLRCTLSVPVPLCTRAAGASNARSARTQPT